VPLLGDVWRSVLAPADFGVWLTGGTGAGKSQLAELAQAHFGAGFTASTLPGSWSSTGNALQELAFLSKDALLVIDDFAPTGNAGRHLGAAPRALSSGRAHLASPSGHNPTSPARGDGSPATHWRRGDRSFNRCCPRGFPPGFLPWSDAGPPTSRTYGSSEIGSWRPASPRSP
jgi:hypothetical protein